MGYQIPVGIGLDDFSVKTSGKKNALIIGGTGCGKSLHATYILKNENKLSAIVVDPFGGQEKLTANHRSQYGPVWQWPSFDKDDNLLNLEDFIKSIPPNWNELCGTIYISFQHEPHFYENPNTIKSLQKEVGVLLSKLLNLKPQKIKSPILCVLDSVGAAGWEQLPSYISCEHLHWLLYDQSERALISLYGEKGMKTILEECLQMRYRCRKTDWGESVPYVENLMRGNVVLKENNNNDVKELRGLNLPSDRV